MLRTAIDFTGDLGDCVAMDRWLPEGIVADIAAGEEITWDYSTSIDCEGWSLECRCGAKNCRKVIRPWQELSDSDRVRLTSVALKYLR